MSTAGIIPAITLRPVEPTTLTLQPSPLELALGSAVAEVMASLGSARILVRMGVPDCYAHGASRPYLMRELGFDARAILLTVANWIAAPIDVGLLDEEGPVSPMRSSVNAESL